MAQGGRCPIVLIRTAFIQKMLSSHIYICTKNRSYAVFMDVCVKNYGGYAFHVI